MSISDDDLTEPQEAGPRVLYDLEEGEILDDSSDYRMPTDPRLQSVITIESEDESDLGHLRKMALESKWRKTPVIEKEQKIQRPPSVEIMEQGLNGTLEEGETESEEDEEDLYSDLLRQKLLIDMLSKTNDDETEVPQEKVAEATVFRPIELNEPTASPLAVNEVCPVPKVTPAKEPTAPTLSKRFIITFSSDEESEDDADCDRSACQQVIPSISEFLKDARNNCHINLRSSPLLPEMVSNLPFGEQEEYLRLKREIELREQKAFAAKSEIQQKRIKLNQVKKSIAERKKMVSSLKAQKTLRNSQLTKAQSHERKMHELYLAASRVVAQTQSKLNQVSSNLSEAEAELKSVSNQSNQIEDSLKSLNQQLFSTSRSKSFQKTQLESKNPELVTETLTPNRLAPKSSYVSPIDHQRVIRRVVNKHKLVNVKVVNHRHKMVKNNLNSPILSPVKPFIVPKVAAAKLSAKPIPMVKSVEAKLSPVKSLSPFKLTRTPSLTSSRTFLSAKPIEVRQKEKMRIRKVSDAKKKLLLSQEKKKKKKSQFKFSAALKQKEEVKEQLKQQLLDHYKKVYPTKFLEILHKNLKIPEPEEVAHRRPSRKGLIKLPAATTLPQAQEMTSCSRYFDTCIPHDATSYETTLSCISSYRLSSNFGKATGGSFLDPAFTHGLDANKLICNTDLLGKWCRDKSCRMQHKSQYLLTSHQKLMDILMYNPKVAGISEADMKNGEKVKEKLKDFLVRFCIKDPNSCEEQIALQLVKLVRSSLDVKNNSNVCGTIGRRMDQEMRRAVFKSAGFKIKFKVKDRNFLLVV